MKLLKKGGAISVLVVLVLLFAVMSMGVTEETPLGSIAGTLKMSENGAPLAGVAVILTPLYSSEEDSSHGRVSYSDKDGNFIMSGVPTGSYKIEASAKVHTLEPTDVSVKEGGVTHLDLELNPELPSLNLYTSQRVFTPDETPQIEAHGFGTDKTVDVKVYKIDLSRFLEKGSIYGVLYSVSNSTFRSGDRKDPSQIGKLVDSFSHEVKNYDSEGSFMDVIDLKHLDQGFYWIQSSYGAEQDGAFLNISTIGLITKASPGKVLSFVTDLKTGQPVSNAELSYNNGAKWVAFGKTDADGLSSNDLPGKGRKLLILATQGKAQAVSAFYMFGKQADENSRSYEGDEDYDNGGPPDSSTTVFVYTDRPIYRPGDDVQFKGFARRRVGSQYNLPGAGTVHCELRDLDNNLVKSFDTPMEDNGSFHGHYQTSTEDSPGWYTFTFKALGQEEQLNFTLAAYRKPEFTIKVTWSKNRYTIGEKLKATVKCEYYFGGPVAGAKVDATLYRNEDWYSDEWDSEDYDVETDSEYSDEGSVGGDFVNQGSGVTDANGEAVFEFDAKSPKLSNDYWYTPNYRYTLSADVTEAGDKYFSGQGSVKVSQGAVDIKVDPDRYIVTPGKTVDVTISAFKSDDQSPAPNQTVQVMYGTEEWSRRRDYYNYKWHDIFTPEGNLSVTTGTDGKAHFALPARHAGSYIIKASTVDVLGNTVKQQAYVYSGADDYVPPPTSPALSITLDKKLYKVGDPCQILIATAKPGATALLTVEAEDVMYKRVVRIEKQSKLVTIPVDKSYLPRVTVSVVAVQNKQFLEASEALKIDVSARTLKLDVSSDKSQYLPGGTATYKIHAIGADGKPAAADLSLGVVDEAIYALKEDHTNPVRAFYPARPNRVSTHYSFPELYLDGGDKGGEIPVRINFKDTAAWVPAIRTDGNGDATVQVKLPDNLTKWRTTVVGVSDATDVGLATYDVVVNKPLMVRLEGPKFIVNGDHQQIAAIINNNSGADADVHVTLQASGFVTHDSTNQTLHIANGSSDSVSWDLGANAAGPGKLVAKAWIDNGPNDGVEQDIDIKPHAREVAYRTAGDIRPETKFNIMVRRDADPNVGRFKLTVTPTIGTSVYDTLDSLIDYPYGCVEQTMSRFLPAMTASAALKQVGLLRPDLAKKVPVVAEQSLAKLKNMQHSDGGWGWWEYDVSEPFMTAYVLDGLRQAKAAGYKVSPFITDRAVAWASKNVDSWPRNDSRAKRDLLYEGYVLAQYGKKDVGAKALREVNLDGESAAMIALAAMLANELGPDYVDQRDKLMQQVREKAVVDINTAYWKPKIYSNYFWWDYDDIYGAEVSALPLQALESISPDDPLIEKGVRGLLMSREGSWWWSTRDSSFALRTICWYLQRESAPTGPSVVHVSLNGAEVAQLKMDLQNLRGLSPTFVVPIGGLKQGQNDVTLRVDGAKLAYYTVDFTQYATAPTLGKIVNNTGLTIERSYHVLSAQQMEDGTLKMRESTEPVSTVKSGDLIQCDLVVTSDRDRSYVMITDPIPSNCHPEVDKDVDRGSDYQWDYWYANQTVFDDRLTFFSTDMPAGRHVITYVLRAESPGIAHVLPPVAGNMYNPDDKASDSEHQLGVTR